MKYHLPLPAAIALLAGSVAGQELPVQSAIVDDRTVLMMPSVGPETIGASSFAGIDFGVSLEQDRLTYRATYLGRTFTAHADASAPLNRLAFDPGERRFRTISSTVAVELVDYDLLGLLVQEQGAVAGKAYPELGFALIRLGAEADPALAVELLGVDPRVRSAQLLFEPATRRPAIVRSAGHPSSIGSDTRLSPTESKDSLSSNLYAYTNINRSTDFSVEVTVANSGIERSEPAVLRASLFALVPDESTADPDDRRSVVESRVSESVPAIDGKGFRFRTDLDFSTDSLEGDRTYYLQVFVEEATTGREEPETLARTFTGFTLDSLKRIQHVCAEPGRGGTDGVPDPLLAQQWHLDNTGQNGYAEAGGVAGEDLQMDGILEAGPTGDGVRVAVVDTGMEVCHPDLKDNVEEGASFHFDAFGTSTDPSYAWGFRMDASDPFNFDSTGGHGTSVAGLIAGSADNGIGGRGVAPGARLRGFNALNASSQFSAMLDSLGGSDLLPNSRDVDIFNMSFGGGGSRPDNPHPYFERLFSYGVHRLRSGLGAIYVKSAGNGFDDCNSMERLINERIGCLSSTGDDRNSLPYLIVTGAFNADGRKASYASAGPNLWISAPAGQYGRSRPALLTVDQMGTERGTGVLRDGNPLDGESAVNPHGDYTGRMNGTSAAAALVSGGVALLLETEPGLTWRDVKHILAKTARKIDPDIESVEETIGTVTRTLRLPWTENAAGYSYHDWYGFGALDLDAAIELADEYTPDSLGAFRRSGWFESGVSGSIPDNDGTGIARTLSVSTLAGDAYIEAVQIEVDIDHEFPNDLGIHLVSPHGTRAVINQVFNETLALDDPGDLRWRLLSNAFYGEAPNGDWQIEVFDAAEDDTGDLDAWRLRFYYGSHPEEPEATED